MKTLKIVIFLFLASMLASCDPLYSIYFVNRYDKNVYVEYYVSNYPDTTLLGTGCVYNPATQSQDTAHIYETIGRLPDFFYYGGTRVDTVSFFIFDSDSVDYYSWDTVVKKNMVLQRYDLSMFDLENLMVGKGSSMLHFPPTEQMKHIHMWPPYGTYDENRNIIEDKSVISDNKRRTNNTFFP